MSSAEAKLTFDADTSAYNAHMQAAARHTHGLVDGLKEAAAPLLNILSVAGAIEAAIEGVKGEWEAWRRQIEMASEANRKLGTDLAATLGTAGLIGSLPQIRTAITESQGPLSIDQKKQALGVFAGDLPGLSASSAITFIGQAQKAAAVVGPENIPQFAQAVALGVQSGLSQKQAGDVAMAVTQSGAHGLDAFQRAAGRFAEDHPDEKSRAGSDFLGFLRTAGADVFGSRPTQILGGQALQRQLHGDVSGLLERQVALAEHDPMLAKQREIQATQALTETTRQKHYGDRAESEEELNAIVDRYAAQGDRIPMPTSLLSTRTMSRITEQLQQNERRRISGDRNYRFAPVSPGQAGNEYASFVAGREGLHEGSPGFERRRDEILAELKSIREHTSKPQGAERYRNEAQDRDNGEESR